MHAIQQTRGRRKKKVKKTKMKKMKREEGKEKQQRYTKQNFQRNIPSPFVHNDPQSLTTFTSPTVPLSLPPPSPFRNLTHSSQTPSILPNPSLPSSLVLTPSPPPLPKPPPIPILTRHPPHARRTRHTATPRRALRARLRTNRRPRPLTHHCGRPPHGA